MVNPQSHWNAVYESKGDEQVSWTEPVPEVSLRLLHAAGMTKDSCVVDVGGGNSHLVEHLVAEGLDCLAVLDVAPAAIERARQRLDATLKPGGAAVIATFAQDGPVKCSGLAVSRYSPEALAAEFAGLLTPVESIAHTHTTPWGATQSFQYSRFVR